jgi:ABC-type dipeptide/oligopeptide/nickel transport system permease component
MIGFILKRLLYTIVVMIIASMAIFYALRVAPGDPVNAILNPTAMEQARAALRARLGLNLPIYEQYFVYVKHLFQGDAGKSLITGQTIPHVL